LLMPNVPKVWGLCENALNSFVLSRLAATEHQSRFGN
jgi:hypothetical protein